ncbi:MAG: hypothetical protein ACOC38_02515 [Promethearchaeia archaeon]
MESSIAAPVTRGSNSYRVTVNSARHYLRKRDFLTYASQLLPEPLGSETWSLAWGYIRRFDDILDSPSVNKTQAVQILENEQSVVETGFEGELRVNQKSATRHLWLAQFFDNERRYYAGRALPAVRNLYDSAWSDVRRRNEILSQHEMDRLLYKKARSFFQLYFILGRLDLGGYLDDFSYLLGMGLGMLDDMLDILIDQEAGYINITQEEIRALDIDLDPTDKRFVKEAIDRGYLTYKAKKILELLLRARRLTRRLRMGLLRKFILRLTEIFAAPIFEGRFIPGQTYFFRGGKLADLILPSNESIAYRIGHQALRAILAVPQVVPVFFKAYHDEWAQSAKK